MTENSTTERTIVHASFTLEREYPVSPERVFAAFATKAAKRVWFGNPDGPEPTGDLDFREGGAESNISAFDGHVYAFLASYLDIVENSRIVYSYTLLHDEVKLSASLTTIELLPTTVGTQLTFTEHGAFFDGLEDPAMREQGTREMLDVLGAALTK